MGKHLFLENALEHIPKILTLQDRNPHSPTFGCFDRNYWHYKIIDFPSGMAQEFVFPLALVYSLQFENNPYYGQQSVRDWIIAGMRFAARSAHNDGSCDDYFPYEKAGGATAFSLLASIQSYILLNMDDQPLLDFFEKRADWLANHEESGQLANHQALIILCLDLLSNLLKTNKWREFREKKLNKLLSWQDEEGWFQEYEGCDPGYHTLTISTLAEVHELNPDSRVQEALQSAIHFASHFVHSDGSFGGEYGSRNTSNFFPHGFELAGKWMPEALSINDRYLQGLERGLKPAYEDDHTIGHHLWNYLLAWRDYLDERPETTYPEKGRQFFPNAKLMVDRRENSELYLALNKGGVFKLFRDGKQVSTDTQISILMKNKKHKNAVVHLIDDFDVEIEDDRIEISGRLAWVNHTLPDPAKYLIFRVFMVSVGRFFSDFVRKILQKILITGRNEAPFRFDRTFFHKDGEWRVRDEIMSDNWDEVKSIGIGSSQASIYVVMSKTYQRGQLEGWTDLTGHIRDLKPGELLVIERKI